MAAGYPVKVNYLTGDVLTAADLNDLAGTVNLYDPTAKGDLFPATAADAVSRLAVGANDTVLTADSTAATGMKWAAAGGGGGKSYALLSTTTFSGASITVSSLSGYDNFYIIFRGVSCTGASATLNFQLNGSTTLSDYVQTGLSHVGSSPYDAQQLVTSYSATNQGNFILARMADVASDVMTGVIQIAGANTSGKKMVTCNASGGNFSGTNQKAWITGGIFEGSGVISSIKFITSGSDSNFDAGSVLIYAAV